MHWLVVFSVGIDLYATMIVSRGRLHDLGHSGWLAALLFVPLVNLAVIVFMLLKKGEGENRYGLPSQSRSAFAVLLRLTTRGRV